MADAHKTDEASIVITLPRWMLEDLRARAHRKNMTVVEWLRHAATLQRNLEDSEA